MKPSVSYFARSNFREHEKPFGIYQPDRLFHLYLLGKTGSGKSTVLKNLMYQDIHHNRGICVFDLHNDLIPSILEHLPNEKQNNIIYLDLTNPLQEFGYNPLRKVSLHKRSLVASALLQSFQKIWGAQSWGSKMEHILRACLLSLLDQDEADLSHIRKILLDKHFRASCLKNIQNEELVDFWLKEFPLLSKNDFLPILNKVTALLSHSLIKKFLIENKKQLSLRSMMDKGHVLLVNISVGQLGSDSAYLISSLLLNALSSAGFSRAEIPEQQRRPFFIYLDEYQHYTTKVLLDMWAELRKFKVGIICANQYLSQISPEIRDAVLGNVGSILCFRLSQADSKFFQQEFYPVFHHSDFTSLSNYDIYLRLMINGKPSQAFSATTLPFPLDKVSPDF